MQALSRKSFCMSSFETMRSFSGARAVGDQVRLDRLELVPERVEVDDQVLERREVADRVDLDRSRSPNSVLTSSTWLMQASTVLPLALQAQEPQIALRHEYRTASVPSCSSCSRRIASSSVKSLLVLEVEGLPVRLVRDVGLVAEDVEGRRRHQ